jgi:hypothetical protein
VQALQGHRVALFRPNSQRNQTQLQQLPVFGHYTTINA